MKKVVFLMALLLCAACQQRVQQQFVEEECEGQDTIDQSLIFKTTDSITYHTTVMYAGEHMQGDFVMSAMYGLDEFNSMGEYLLTPEVDVFQITMHLKHKGAHKPETIVLVTDGKPQRIEPNFTQAVAKGEFMLLFNISLYNNTQSVPKHIINAKKLVPFFKECEKNPDGRYPDEADPFNPQKPVGDARIVPVKGGVGLPDLQQSSRRRSGHVIHIFPAEPSAAPV